METETRLGRVRPATITKHSLTIAGHRTSISLEHVFWQALRKAADLRGVPVAALVAEIDAAREGANLSSAIRVFVLASIERDTSLSSARPR